MKDNSFKSFFKKNILAIIFILAYLNILATDNPSIDSSKESLKTLSSKFRMKKSDSPSTLDETKINSSNEQDKSSSSKSSLFKRKKKPDPAFLSESTAKATSVFDRAVSSGSDGLESIPEGLNSRESDTARSQSKSPSKSPGKSFGQDDFLNDKFSGYSESDMVNSNYISGEVDEHNSDPSHHNIAQELSEALDQSAELAKQEDDRLSKNTVAKTITSNSEKEPSTVPFKPSREVIITAPKNSLSKMPSRRTSFLTDSFTSNFPNITTFSDSQHSSNRSGVASPDSSLQEEVVEEKSELDETLLDSHFILENERVSDLRDSPLNESVVNVNLENILATNFNSNFNITTDISSDLPADASKIVSDFYPTPKPRNVTKVHTQNIATAVNNRMFVRSMEQSSAAGDESNVPTIFGFWGSTSLDKIRGDDSFVNSKTKTISKNQTLGFDADIGDVLIGSTISLLKSRIGYVGGDSDGDKIKTNGYVLALYGTFDLKRNMFIRALASYGVNKIHSYSFKPGSGMGEAKYKQRNSSGQIELGYNGRMSTFNYFVAGGIGYAHGKTPEHKTYVAGAEFETTAKDMLDDFDLLGSVGLNKLIKLNNYDIIPSIMYSARKKFAGSNPGNVYSPVDSPDSLVLSSQQDKNLYSQLSLGLQIKRKSTSININAHHGFAKNYKSIGGAIILRAEL